ncbi:hypothetical protein QQS21_006205 [Conoideocrella luteorostrata]|uniref:Uncharacterized protein n=1 Tax=Conoideocrella luteorostrata TaxID=1105319 RepID=A0AAJ0CQQ6_9HYPO|nr:hypothetical protein QQS21_006205 [Conoideocrella luteorostrata]
MKSFIAAIVLLASVTVAHPTLQARDGVCPDLLYSVAQCCATDVLGVASLDCKTPSSAFDSQDFKNSCSGGAAMCCTVPAASQGVLCQPAI